MDIATATAIAKAVGPLLLPPAIDTIKKKLKPTELEKALIAGIEAARKQEDKYSLDGGEGLFFKSAPDGLKGVQTFLTDFFKKDAVQQELKKPLTNDGQISIPILVKEFEGLAKEEEYQKVNPVESRIEPWLTAFQETYFSKTSNYVKFLVAKEDYLEQLARRFDDIKFGGIAVAGQEIEKSEKLAHIFVMPDVREELQSPLDKGLHAEKITAENLESKTGLTRQAQLLQEQRYFAKLENRFGRKFLAQGLLNQSQSKKVVLLGAPGSGKSTLMSYFAVMLAQNQPQQLELSSEKDWLPILIQIRDLARQPQMSILDYIRHFAEKNMAVHTLPVGFFKHWLSDGRALILLDGLDEVAEESKRYEIVSRIDSFLGQFKENIAIITSRPAGYKRDFFRTDEFTHYQLQPFNDAKIKEFINRWYDSRFPDKPEAERRKESLTKALNDNDRIKLLAKNPLLLTIIALIHRYQAQLPKERYKLYEKAVETLLTSWDADKEISSHKSLQYLDLDDLKHLMQTIAYWIHSHGSTGDSEGGTLVDCDELMEQLKREIKTLKQIELYEAEEEARRFVKLIRERTGLLNEQGTDCYAFVHKTFQEYLCAQDINYQADNEDDFNLILDKISNHIHDPHWQEVLLLLIAQQKPKKAAKAIAAILDRNSEYESWLHRDLIFAGQCLAENPKNLRTANRNLSQDILERLVDLEVSKREQIGDRISQQVFQTLCSLNETDFQAQALQLLKDKAEPIDEERSWKYQIALGDKEAVINILLGRLEDSDSGVRSSAASALVKFGKSLPEVVDALLERLRDSDSEVRDSAAFALGNLGNRSEEVVDALKGLLQDSDSEVCGSAALALGMLGDSSEEAVDVLLGLLLDSDSRMRGSAALALGILGDSSGEEIDVLLELLLDSDSEVRQFAALALGMLRDSSGEVVDALVEQLQDEDFGVRRYAAEALGKLGDSSGEVVDALVEQLQDEDFGVRRYAAEALGKLGDSSGEVVDALKGRFQDEDFGVRFSAASALRKLGKKASDLIPYIVQWISQHQNSEYVGRGIDVLWDLVAESRGRG